MKVTDEVVIYAYGVYVETHDKVWAEETNKDLLVCMRAALEAVAAKLVPDGEVLLEHSGCGHGIQANQLSVRLCPGDKVIMVRGPLGKALLPAAPSPTNEGE